MSILVRSFLSAENQESSELWSDYFVETALLPRIEDTLRAFVQQVVDINPKFLDLEVTLRQNCPCAYDFYETILFTNKKDSYLLIPCNPFNEGKSELYVMKHPVAKLAYETPAVIGGLDEVISSLASLL